jgi:hypothetical protein
MEKEQRLLYDMMTCFHVPEGSRLADFSDSPFLTGHFRAFPSWLPAGTVSLLW